MSNIEAIDLALPTRLNRLSELAYNLWWSWHPEASWLFSYLDPALWEMTSHNPVKMLRQIAPAKLLAAATIRFFCAGSTGR